MTVCLIAAFLEVPLIESAIAVIMPNAGDLQIRIGSIAYLLVYTVLWHVVGTRLAHARTYRHTISSVGRGTRLNPAFGVLGVVLVVMLLGTLVAVAWRRATALADTAARAALNRATAETLTALTGEQAREIGDSARAAALWPDWWFTVSVMGMLAALAVWIGHSAVARHEAIALHLARRHADRATDTAASLAADHADARRRYDTQAATAHDRGLRAERVHAALNDRFARARQVVRHHLARAHARPDATTELLPRHNDMPPT